jgi:two-component system, chemotaxis family, chemotaxis protein CheY
MDTTILVVDDSKMQVHLIERILKDLGYTKIETAMSCDDAKKILLSIKIDLILSDWHMPGGTGLDLLKYVRSQKQSAAIPFVMVTTEHDKANIFEAAKAGLQNYLFKPVSKDMIKKKLYDLAKLYPSLNPPHEGL